MSIFSNFFKPLPSETQRNKGTVLSIFNRMSSADNVLSKDEIANILKTNPDALAAFEESYSKNVLDKVSDDFFEINAKQAVSKLEHLDEKNSGKLEWLTSRIVDELLMQTSVYCYDGKQASITRFESPNPDIIPVTLKDFDGIEKSLHPDLTGTMYKRDIPQDTSDMILYFYDRWRKSTKSEDKEMSYHMFRQGIDILDLDPITYEIIGTNPNSIGHWFPQLVNATKDSDFFKLPRTSFLKVPITLLQLTRQEYQLLSPTTIKIVDEFCRKAFDLNENEEYFIKTGTYSSKFDFRNAYVHGAKEVRELGEYLLYIHFQALQMAGPLCKPCIYGASTTNEWAVREFIRDKENNPCIYKGMPLHTEYRIFADCDTKEILGMSPYWRSDIMKQRFGFMNDADSPHQKHDYVIYCTHEDTLMKRYEENKDKVLKNIASVINKLELAGQWSIDVMQNGQDFYIIDMAIASNSALNDCIPPNRLKKFEENWLPTIK